MAATYGSALSASSRAKRDRLSPTRKTAPANTAYRSRPSAAYPIPVPATPMTDNTAPKRIYLRVCRNPHEPFFWDADEPFESCPDPHCQGGPHDTYIIVRAAKGYGTANSLRYMHRPHNSYVDILVRRLNEVERERNELREEAKKLRKVIEESM